MVDLESSRYARHIGQWFNRLLMEREIRDKNDRGTIVSMKLTDKQCRFADAVSSGINPSTAYRDIYNMSDKRPATATEAASRLMKNSNVVARIEAVTEAAEAKIASEVAWTKQRIVSELSINVDLGRETKQLAASNQALKLIGSAVGSIFEPDTVAVSVTGSVLHGLSDDVLNQLAALGPSEPEPLVSEADTIEASYKLLDTEPE